MKQNNCIQILIIEKFGEFYAKFTLNGHEYILSQEDLYFAVVESFCTNVPQKLELISTSTPLTTKKRPILGS